jgi:hypothetical protein
MATRGDYGSFIPTTQVWDVGEIYSADNISPELKEILVRLYQNLNVQAMASNTNVTGIYDTSEFVNGKTYFPNPTLNSMSGTTPTQRQVFRTVLNYTTGLPNTGSVTIPHNLTITNNFTFTQIYGATSDTTNHVYLPLPYASAAGGTIELSVGVTNVTITTSSNRSSFTPTYIVLEYLKS